MSLEVHFAAQAAPRVQGDRCAAVAVSGVPVHGLRHRALTTIAPNATTKELMVFGEHHRAPH